MAIKSDNTLWATGYNSFGTFGVASQDQDKFIKILDNAANVTADIYHSFIIKTDKTLWATGENTYYGLGTGDRNDLSVFTKVKLNE